MRQFLRLPVAFFGLAAFMLTLGNGQLDRQTALAVKTDSIVPLNAMLYYLTYDSSTPIVVLSGVPVISTGQDPWRFLR